MRTTAPWMELCSAVQASSGEAATKGYDWLPRELMGLPKSACT